MGSPNSGRLPLNKAEFRILIWVLMSIVHGTRVCLPAQALPGLSEFSIRPDAINETLLRD